MKVKLHHPALVVPDLIKAMAFYSDLFDLEKIKESRMTEASAIFDSITGLKGAIAKFCLLKGDGYYLELFEFVNTENALPEVNFSASSLGIRHLAFQVDNLTQASTKLISLGGSLLGEQKKIPGGGAAIYCRDPFGNIIEFTKPEENFPSI